MANYTPCDGEETILAQEDGPPIAEIPSFLWWRLRDGKSWLVLFWILLSNVIVDTKLLGDVTSSITSCIIEGESLMWWGDHSGLVERVGAARFIGETEKTTIDEPLALIGLMRFFETISHPLELADFNLQSEKVVAALNEENHPLAIFSQAGLIERFTARPDRKSSVGRPRGLKRVFPEDEAERKVKRRTM
jgi:hypothetical protein